MEIWLSALSVIVGIGIGIYCQEAHSRKKSLQELKDAKEELGKSVAEMSRINNNLAQQVNTLMERVNAHEMRFGMQGQNMGFKRGMNLGGTQKENN